jgi:predicted O-methyltransferase YrrM
MFDIDSSIIDNVTPLCVIMEKYGSDKGSIRPSKHNYTRLYHSLFNGHVNSAMRIFELGIGTNNVNLASNMGENGKPGASLKGWSEYFPNSQIFGADIDRDILFQESNIKTYYCNQVDRLSIREMWNHPDLNDNFDIILEDGLHTFDANVCFFENSIHKLKPGGLYIIEDVIAHNLHLYQSKIEQWKSIYPGLSFRIENIPNECNNFDNCLIVIQNNNCKFYNVNSVYNTEYTNKLYKNKHIFYEIYEKCGKTFMAGCGSYLFDGVTYEYYQGMYDKQELLFNSTKHVKNVLEIGSYMGHSMFIMLLANPNVNITCIDIDDKFTSVAVDVLNKYFNNAITFIHSDSISALSSLTERYDFFHIDGDHQNDYIMKEFSLIQKLNSNSEYLNVMFDDEDCMRELQRYIDTNLRVKMKVIPDCKWANVLYKISTQTPYAGQYA